MTATPLQWVVDIALAFLALVALFMLYSRIVFRGISAGITFLGGLVLVAVTVVVARRLFW